MLVSLETSSALQPKAFPAWKDAISKLIKPGGFHLSRLRLARMPRAFTFVKSCLLSKDGAAADYVDSPFTHMFYERRLGMASGGVQGLNERRLWFATLAEQFSGPAHKMFVRAVISKGSQAMDEISIRLQTGGSGNRRKDEC